MPRLKLLLLILIVWLGPTGAASSAEQEYRLGKLGPVDTQFMEQQRARIDELARFDLGKQLQGDKANDLGILQTLLDRRLVRADQTLELQAMGVVMGDLLASELNMEWVIYEDRYGRSRALKIKYSDNFLFPITMISRRAEVGADVQVEKIYGKALELMKAHRQALPFQ
jgi:Domain of unknown function (DUF3806)